MGTEIRWIDGRWPGKLAVASRPRGGDWLGDEIANWRNVGIGTVLSLLAPEEERDLGLASERDEVKVQGMKFISLPIPDRGVPNSESEVTAILEEVDADLAAGKSVVVHCRQGIGRSGLLAACLLVAKGLDPKRAVDIVTAARGVPIPETPEQRSWIDQYASVLASPQMNFGAQNHGVQPRS
jgi:protein-tyrosine phosphatase